MVSSFGSSTLSMYGVMSVTSTAYSSSLSCVGVPGGGVVVYPWSPCPVLSGRWCSRDARYSVEPLPASSGGGGAAGCWTSASRAPVQRAGAAGGRCAGSRRSRGPHGCLPWAQVPAGLGPCVALCPLCVGAPAPAGCQSPGPWVNSGRLHVGVLPCGVAGAPCRCPGRVWQLVWGRV